MPNLNVDTSLANRIPVSMVTGFLGSGKTTLINYLIEQEGMRDTALIINEFGEIGLDHVLVESSFENTLLMHLLFHPGRPDRYHLRPVRQGRQRTIATVYAHSD